MTVDTDQKRSAGSGGASFPGVLAAIAGLALAAAASAGAAPAAVRPLQTAIVDPAVFTGPDAGAGLTRAAAAGVSAIKVPLFWNGVAPARRPAGFEPANPSDPAYSWAGLDAQLRLIRSHGLEPLVYIAGAPTWAYSKVGGTRRVDPAQYRAFALAAVRRYSGKKPGLPRVRFWQAWNEPNKVVDREAKAGVEAWYRDLVNAFAASAHSVPGNAVVAGGLSPFGISTAVAPLTFVRNLLCVPPDTSTRAQCASKIHFDIWSIDPYTAGGPSHVTAKPNDVSVAELPKMKAVLDAAVRGGHVVSTGPMRFWVTEFAWDSNPPDPGGVPLALEGRWVADALHRMWLAGVSLVTWFSLRDQPLATSAYQSGLYRAGRTIANDIPKPALTAFRFPFTAYPDAKRVSVWGRTPTSKAGPVRVEQRVGSAWKRLATLRASRTGIFTGEVVPSGRGPLRAVFPAAANATSLPYSLVNPPDRTFQPFGAQPKASQRTTSSSSAVSQYIENEPSAGGGAASGAGTLAVLPAAGARPVRAPASAIGAVVRATGASGWHAALFGAALAGITAVLGLAAVRRRRTAE